MQETRHAFERCHKVELQGKRLIAKGCSAVFNTLPLGFFLCALGAAQLSDPSDLPKNAFSIFLLLVDHLCVEHIDYALEIGLSGT